MQRDRFTEAAAFMATALQLRGVGPVLPGAA